MCANCGKRNRRNHTPSMKMRFAIWTLYKAEGHTDEEVFAAYYVEKIEKLIDFIYQKVEQAVQKNQKQRELYTKLP